MSFDDPKIIRIACQDAAMLLVTRGMTYSDICCKNGRMRAAVARKVASTCNDMLGYVDVSGFKSYLKSKGVLLDQDRLYRTYVYKSLGALLYQYLQVSNIYSLQMGAVSPERFFMIRTNRPFDVAGVYILYNSTKSMYYVGQSIHLSSRIYQHFNAHGNGDVYADYKYGDKFFVQWKLLSESLFSSLDDMERYYIAKYQAFSSGYNRTSGNKRKKGE